MGFARSDFAVYQAHEAARLIGISSSRIKRWLEGYVYKLDGESRTQPPLWQSKYDNAGDLYLGFEDLIEIRFVDAFVKAGLSLQAVRGLLAQARVIVDCDYPLSTHQFKTDGRTIFLEIWERDKARAIDVKDGQHAFHAIVKPSFRDLEFDENAVVKWFIDGKDKRVSIDPNIAFGQPAIDKTGIATARFFEAYKAEGNLKTAASMFEIPLAAAKQAIEFELRMARHN